MSRKDFSNLDDQIRDIVKSAFDAIDFAGIKKEIDEKTEKTVNEVKIKIKDKSEYINKKMKDTVKTTYETVNNITSNDRKKIQKYIAKRPVGSVSGIMYIIFGGIGSVLFGILLAAYLIGSFMTAQDELISYSIGLVVMLSFFAVSIGLIFKGKTSRKRIRRFRQYVSYLDGKTYCLIEDFAALIDRKNKFIVKDLRKMIELNMFLQGHIDTQQTYFMLNNEVYEDYLRTQEALKKRNEEELKRQDNQKEEVDDPLKKELEYTIEIGKNYIEEIKSISINIHEEAFEIKLNKLQGITNQIFNYVEKNPKKLSGVNKFINQYLPMTLKLVTAYSELSNQTVQGDNIKSAKLEIEKAIDNINIAFENLLDNLFEEIALDISTDISVLETLFTQEGLNKRDFKK